MRIRINRLYAPILTSLCRYFLLWGGRSRGASHFATDYFLHLITGTRYFRGGFLRSTFSEVRGSLWTAFKDRVQAASDAGDVNYADFGFNETNLSVVYYPTKNTIISKGFKKTSLNQSANLKSLEGLTHAIIEEAEDVPEDDFMKFEDSLRTVKANIQIFLLFNPPGKNHWLIKSFFDLTPAKHEGWYAAKPKDIPELLAIHSTFLDNTKNVNESTKKNYLAYGDPNNPRYKPDYYYRNVLGLISEGKKGRIITHAQPMKYAAFKELPYSSFYGLDWGFNDPNAVVECKYSDGVLWVHEIIYKSGMDNEQLMTAMRAKGISNNAKVYYDSARPDNAQTFKKGIEYGPNRMQGFNMLPCTKGVDSIKFGIRELQDVKLFYTETSTNLREEFEEYSWALDANKEPTDAPEDANNHLIDAMRYAYVAHVPKSGSVWGMYV